MFSVLLKPQDLLNFENTLFRNLFREKQIKCSKALFYLAIIYSYLNSQFASTSSRQQTPPYLYENHF